MNWHNVAILWTGILGLVALMAWASFMSAFDNHYSKGTKISICVFVVATVLMLTSWTLLVGGAI